MAISYVDGAVNGQNTTTAPTTGAHGITIGSGDLVCVYVHSNSTGSITHAGGEGAAFTSAVDEIPTGQTARQALFWKVAGASEPASYTFASGSGQATTCIKVFSVDGSFAVDLVAVSDTHDAFAGSLSCHAGDGRVVADGALSLIMGGIDSRGGGGDYTTVDNGYVSPVGLTTNQYAALAHRLWVTGGADVAPITFGPHSNTGDFTYSIHASFVEVAPPSPNSATVNAAVNLTATITATGDTVPQPMLEWAELANTDVRPLDPCPDNTCPYHAGTNANFAGLMDSWSGGAFDTVRNRLVVWGGGHVATYGNYLFAFDFDTETWSELIPTSNFAALAEYQAAGVYPDGKPLSRHTYNSLQYLESTQMFAAFGAAAFSPTGGAGDSRLWLVDMTAATPAWTRGADLLFTVSLGYTAYDRINDRVWYSSEFGGRLAYYDVQTDTHVNKGLGFTLKSDATAAIDTTRNQLLYIGGASGGQAGWLDLNPSTPVRTDLSAVWVSGPSNDLRTGSHHGLVYDEQNDRFIAWPDSGKTIYFIDPVTFNVTTFVPVGGATPDAAAPTGTYGRFNYNRVTNSLALVNTIDSNVFTMSLGAEAPQDNTYQVNASVPLTASVTATGGGLPGSDNWESSIAGTGVIGSHQFDTEAQVTGWTQQDGSASNVYWNTTNQLTGGGCAAMRILKTDADNSGNVRRWIADDRRDFTTGDEFEVVYAMWLSPGLLDHAFLNGGGWKSAIVSRNAQVMNGDPTVAPFGSFQDNEMVIGNAGYRGIIQGYAVNSAGQFYGHHQDTLFNSGCSGTDFVYQNVVDRIPGAPADCAEAQLKYGGLFSQGSGSPLVNTGALKWREGWNFVRQRITLGTFGGGAALKDTRIQIFGAHPGDTEWDPLIDVQKNLGAGPPINTIWWTPFDTNKDPDPTRDDYEVMYDWYIASTDPIPVPQVNLPLPPNTYAVQADVRLSASVTATGDSPTNQYTVQASVPLSAQVTATSGAYSVTALCRLNTAGSTYKSGAIPMPGFIDYGVTDADIVLQADLTVSGANQQGSAVLDLNDNGAGYDFNADGVDVTTNRGLRYNLSAADNTALQSAGQLQLTVDRAFLDDSETVAVTRYLYSNESGNYLCLRDDDTLRPDFGGGGTGYSFPIISPTGKTDQIEYRISWDGPVLEMFVDDLMVMRSTDRTTQPQTWSRAYIGGLTTLAVGPDGYRIKNAQIVKRALTFTPGALTSVGFLSHSFITQGSVDTYFTNGEDVIPWNPGRGYTNDGVTPASSNPYRDSGFICTIFRQLGKAGYFPINNVNRSMAGAFVSNAITQFDNMIGVDGITPQLLFINLGTNEAATGTVSTAQFEANLQTLITNVENAGVKAIVLQEVLSLEADSTFQGAAFQQRVDEYNAVVAGIPAWAIAQGYAVNIGVHSKFAQFGGHTPNLAMYQADNLHPSELGSFTLADGGADLGIAQFLAAPNTGGGNTGGPNNPPLTMDGSSRRGRARRTGGRR